MKCRFCGQKMKKTLEDFCFVTVHFCKCGASYEEDKLSSGIHGEWVAPKEWLSNR